MYRKKINFIIGVAIYFIFTLFAQADLIAVEYTHNWNVAPTTQKSVVTFLPVVQKKSAISASVPQKNLAAMHVSQKSSATTPIAQKSLVAVKGSKEKRNKKASSQSSKFDYGPQPFGPHKTTERWGTYFSEDADGEVRYLLVKPDDDKAYPGVYYIYGRPGLDHRLIPEIRRLASHGFTVFVSHFQEALMIPILIPNADPPEVIGIQNDGFDEFLKSSERTDGKICVVSTVRGGFYGIKLASRKETRCYVGYHPVFVNHAWPEQAQDVTILEDVRKVRVPTLLMIGDADFEVRVNQSKRVAKYLENHNIPVELVLYPGAKRGFDFRTIKRSLADNLAKVDSMEKMVEFLNKQYASETKIDLSTSIDSSVPPY